jgi:hypothetical protein
MEDRYFYFGNSKCDKLRYKGHPGYKWPNKEQRSKIIERAKAESLISISEDVKVSVKVLDRIIQADFNSKFGSGCIFNSGKDSGNRLTKEQHEKIRENKDCLTVKQLAIRYGVSSRTVFKIRSGKMKGFYKVDICELTPMEIKILKAIYEFSYKNGYYTHKDLNEQLGFKSDSRKISKYLNKIADKIDAHDVLSIIIKAKDVLELI